MTSLLLLIIVWLLWTVHQDLSESNERQRGLKTSLTQLISRIEQLLGTRDALDNSASLAAGSINVNTASKAKLQTLPRIGAVTAEYIIAARPYNKIEELRTVQGVTNAIFSEIKDRVSL